MVMNKTGLSALLVLALATGAAAANSYVIVSPGQGAGSTAAVAAAVRAANGTVTKNFDKIGVIVAESNNSNFMASVTASRAAISIAQDTEVQWIKPVATEATSISPGPTGVNSEPFWGSQWNIRQIGADQAAAHGYMGWGVARARVAVLDSGIVTTHPDISPNLNVSLSKSFVPTEPTWDPPFNRSEE